MSNSSTPKTANTSANTPTETRESFTAIGFCSALAMGNRTQRKNLLRRYEGARGILTKEERENCEDMIAQVAREEEKERAQAEAENEADEASDRRALTSSGGN